MEPAFAVPSSELTGADLGPNFMRGDSVQSLDPFVRMVSNGRQDSRTGTSISAKQSWVSSTESMVGPLSGTKRESSATEEPGKRQKQPGSEEGK